MLTRLHVQGYKALRNADTTLEPLTVIVGPNGCGKSSVLEAIAMAGSISVASRNAQGGFSFEELRSKGTPSSISIQLRARISKEDKERVERLLSKEEAPSESTSAAREQVSFLSFLPQDIKEKLAALPEPPRLEDNELLVEVRHEPDRTQWDMAARTPLRLGRDGHTIQNELIEKYFGSIRRLEPDVRVMAQPSYSPDTKPRIRLNGENLASVLSWLQGELPDRFEEIQSQLHEFVPEVERIRTRRAEVTQLVPQDVLVGQDKHGQDVYVQRPTQRVFIGNEILLDFRHANGVPAKHASEGTLLLLGLLTALATSRASTLLLDDVDRGLHPKAQQQLIAYLRKVTTKGVQIIATTHSPYLVLHLDYDEVRLMTTKDGGALIGKLTDHPEYERWREDMTPSEFWTVFGEEWLRLPKTKVEGHD